MANSNEEMDENVSSEVIYVMDVFICPILCDPKLLRLLIMTMFT
jgi:hypothetical protein